MQEKTGISQRRACRLVGLSRTVLAYEPKVSLANEALRQRMVELAGERRRFGYRRLHVLLRREGHQANHKRVFRLYQGAGLAVPKRKRRRGVAVERQPLTLPEAPNQVWSMDFVMDGRPEFGNKMPQTRLDVQEHIRHKQAGQIALNALALNS
jgi:putative transposase